MVARGVDEISYEKKYYLLLGIPFLFIIFITVLHIKNGEKNSVINYIQNNQTDLQDFCKKIRKNTLDTIESYDNWEVTYWSNTGIVEFISKDNRYLRFSYNGFYYSDDDKPLGFQGRNVEFKEHDAGWIWREDTGDNWEYTEKIMDNWYWFEMHF